MSRLLLVLLAGVPFALLGAGVGVWWTARSNASARPTSDRELEFRERIATLQHHTELLERARQASLAGEPGLANIYAEAAERVLRLVETQGDGTAD